MTHDLKSWPEFFDPVIKEKKHFEVRKNDRNFKVGDILRLQEWNPEQGIYTGRFTTREVTYILPGGKFGIDKDYIVMSIR
jgi:hypothetical protein